MEAWAKFVLAGHDSNEWIRPSLAFAMLREQPCFSSASSRAIRRAVWINADKLRCSIDRPDRKITRYGRSLSLWPPMSVGQFEQTTITLSKKKIIPKDDIRWRTFFLSWGSGVTLARFHWDDRVVFEVDDDGLPSKEEYIAACWRGFVVHCVEEDLPIPPYPWPLCRPRLLNRTRIGRAAMMLPNHCPLCRVTLFKKEKDPCQNRSQAEAYGYWLWELHEEAKVKFCHDCQHNMTLRSRAADRLRQQETQSEVTPKPTIFTRKQNERAILRALYDMNIIAPEDLK
jgi:hypothetical protein